MVIGNEETIARQGDFVTIPSLVYHQLECEVDLDDEVVLAYVYPSFRGESYSCMCYHWDQSAEEVKKICVRNTEIQENYFAKIK